MPREQRKRGKKHKGKDVSADTIEKYDQNDYAPREQLTTYDEQDDNFNTDAPFGIVDPDVKGYFRTVNDQLKEWQDEGIDTDIDVDLDPNERKHSLLLTHFPCLSLTCFS